MSWHLTISLSPLDDDASPLSVEAFAVLAGSVPARSVTRRFDVADVHADDALAGWSATGGAPDSRLRRRRQRTPTTPRAGTAPDSAPELDAAEEVELEMVAAGRRRGGQRRGRLVVCGAPPMPPARTFRRSPAPRPTWNRPISRRPIRSRRVPSRRGRRRRVPSRRVRSRPGRRPRVPSRRVRSRAGPQPSGPPVGVGAAADPIELSVDAGPLGRPPAPEPVVRRPKRPSSWARTTVPCAAR